MVNLKSIHRPSVFCLFILNVILFSFFYSGNFKVCAFTQTINSEGKNEPEGTVKTYLSGVCGEDYRLVTPVNADVWEINVTIISELTTQNVHIRIYEVIGDYPYNYDEQINVPSARGIGKANLVVMLNTSKTYEIWVRDAYAKPFTGIIIENWHPYVRNGGFEERDPSGRPFCTHWVDMGRTGYGSGENTYQNSKVIGLQQYSHGSTLWQEILLDRKDLVFAFWFRPYPEGTSITFQAFFDDIIVYNATFKGEYTDYEWRQVIVFLEPVLIDNNLEAGKHEIMFLVPASDLPHAWVEIDEVSIQKVTGMDKIDAEIWCEISTNYIEVGNPIIISGHINILTNQIVSLMGILTIELDYSYDDGKSWWFLSEENLDINNEFHTAWKPIKPREYVIRAVIYESQYFTGFESWTEPLIVGSFVNIDIVEVSDPRCDVGTSQYIKFHASYIHSEADAEGIIVKINGNEYITNESGWIGIFISVNDIGKSILSIDSITNVDGYRILIDYPSITWDKIEIMVDSPQRLDINSDDIKWSGKYLYNDEVFQGSLILNDTLSKNNVGKNSYKIMGISDQKYGLTSFTSNDFEVIFDRVNIEVTVSDNRIDVGEEPDITVSAKYEYDSTPFQGSISLVQPLSHTETGEYDIKVESINDPLYGLTAFTQNEAKCIGDRIKIVGGGVSQESTFIKNSETVWFKAEYEYDSEIFDGSKGVLYINDEPLVWSSVNLRWEKEVTSDSPATKTFEVTGVQDDKYGLSTFNDVFGSLSIQWKQQGIPGFPYESIILGIMVGIILLWCTRKYGYLKISLLP